MTATAQELFDLFHQAADIQAIFAELTAIWRSDRRSTYAAWGETAAMLADTLARDGLELVENFRFVADGLHPHGDWPALRAWDIAGSDLWLLNAPGDPPERLTGYPENLCATMMYSAPTPPGGVEAELVAFDADRPSTMAGKAVMISDRKGQPGVAAEAGAVGLVGDFIHELTVRPELYDQAKGLTRWENAALLYLPFSGLWGFNVTPATGRRLRGLLARGPVRVKARVDTAFDASGLHHVRGVLPGADLDDRVLLIAHAFEVGACDNAMGVAAVLHAVRLVRDAVAAGRLPAPKRSIEAQFSYEVLSTLTLFQAARDGAIPGWPGRYACGLNVDSAGLPARPESPVNFSRPPAGLPTLAGRLLADLLAAAKRREPRFTWREALMTNDNVMLSDPMLGCPCALLGHQHTVAYHTDGDTPEILDPQTVRLVTAAIAAFAYQAANAPEADVARQGPFGEVPAEWLARADLRRVGRRLVWGPLFRSARLLPAPYDSWFEWNTRGLVPLYQFDARRPLAEAFTRAAIPPDQIDQFAALAQALAQAGIIEMVARE